MEELEAAVDSAAPHKSPGLDGLSYEFYRVTLQEVGPPLVAAFNAMMAEGLLPASFRQGVVRLLPKVAGIPAAPQLRPSPSLERTTNFLPRSWWPGYCQSCLLSSSLFSCALSEAGPFLMARPLSSQQQNTYTATRSLRQS